MDGYSGHGIHLAAAVAAGWVENFDAAAVAVVAVAAAVVVGVEGVVGAFAAAAVAAAFVAGPVY